MLCSVDSEFATGCQILKAEMHQIRLRLGLCHRPRRGSFVRNFDAKYLGNTNP